MNPRLNPTRGLALVVAVCSILAAPFSVAGADVVFDSFDPGGGFHPQDYIVAASAVFFVGGPATSRVAAQFQVSAAAPDFALDSVTLPIAQSPGGPSLLRVRLAADVGGTTPGATIEVLSLNEPVPPLADPFTSTTRFHSVTHPRLSAGERYWIVTELSALPNANIQYLWFGPNSGQTVPLYFQQQVGGLTADPWTGSGMDADLAFRVEGTPVTQACCNPATGACRLVEPATCQGLDLRVIAGSTACTPNPCPPACPADFNGSGGLSVQDIFDFLAAYFTGCP